LLITSIYANRLYEKFEQPDDIVPLKSLNFCGRNIVFPYFARNNFTASQRALIRDNVITYPVGRCNINKTNGVVNESHSIVYENSLFYNLISSCLALRIHKMYQDNKNIIIEFKTRTIEDIINLTSFMALNPLYVEFVVNSNKTSSAYRLVSDINRNDILYSNVHDIRKDASYTTTFRFEPTYNGSSDKTFNYQELSSNQTALSGEDIQNMIVDKILNIRVYYLDQLSSSFQNIGRTLSFNDQNGSILLFDKNYQNYFNSDKDTQLYEFMNNIAIMYTNFVYPTFTFDLSINVPAMNRDTLKNNKMFILKVFMNNTIGQYQSCSNIKDTVGSNNNNILGIVIEGIDDLFYYVYFFTGKGNTCNFPNDNALRIKLPYLTANNNINLITTITPNERLVFANWIDINSGDNSKKIVFGKLLECKKQSGYDVRSQQKEDSTVDNALSDLFPSRIKSNNVPLENITIAFNKDFIKKVDSCTLGYVNFYNKFNEYK
jgi:hypothetical protein